MDIDVPETYDWREAHKNCVQPIANIAPNQGNCSSSYVFATMSAVEDRICMNNGGEKVQLSKQEIIDCDVGSFGCVGGYVNKVLQFGRSKGFILEECSPVGGQHSQLSPVHSVHRHGGRG